MELLKSRAVGSRNLGGWVVREICRNAKPGCAIQESQHFLLILLFLLCQNKYFSFPVRNSLCTAAPAGEGETVEHLNHVSN